MSSVKSRTLDELYELKYNLTLDMYRRRSRAYVVEVATKSGVDEKFHPALIFLGNWAGSLAFKLDPYWQSSKLDRRANVVPYSRTLVPSIFPVQVVTFKRSRKFICIPSARIVSKWKRTSFTTSSGASFIGGQWGIYPRPDTSSQTNGEQFFANQSSCWGFINDTSDSTRNPKRKPGGDAAKRAVVLKNERIKPPKPSSNTAKRFHQGEFELYVPEFITDRSVIAKTTIANTLQLQAVGGGPSGTEPLWAHNHNTVSENEFFPGPSASVDRAGVDSYAVSERANAQSVMTKNLDKLVQQALPARKYYNLIYQIGELKDLGQTVLGTLAIWIELERLIGRKLFKDLLRSQSFMSVDVQNKILSFAGRLKLGDRPDQKLASLYLNFKFGWQSMVSAYDQYAKSPERISKDINRLIELNGKNASLRSGLHYSEPVATTPTITFYKNLRALNDVLKPASKQAIRDVELRCVINSGINLPRVDLPTLRKTLYAEKLGAYPTPSDMYDLLPWSWLFDWFFGASDYLHVMDAVNGQRNLFNYGLISYVSHTKVIGTWQNYYDNSTSTLIYPPGGQPPIVTRAFLNREATFLAKYQLRKDISAFAGMADYSGKGTNPYQKSILAALFSQFARTPGRR